MATAAIFPTGLLALSNVGGELPGFPEATLSGSHSAAVTTITLTATVPTAWPTAGWVTIDSEIIQYTGKSGSTLTGATRGAQSAYGGSAAATHADQAKVGFYLTPQAVNQFIADLIATQTKIGTGASTPSGTTNVLTATGTGTSAWAAPATGAVTKIAETIVTGSDAASIVFSSIPGTYRHLILKFAGRSSNGGAGPDFDWLSLRLNADSGANYDYENLINSNALVSGGEFLAQTRMRIARVPIVADTAGMVGVAEYTIFDYARTNFYKMVTMAGTYQIGTAAGQTGHVAGSGNWRSTAAVTSVTLVCDGGNIVIGSVATLWGIS